MKNTVFLTVFFFPLVVFGIVDTRSAGYSKTFIDFTLPDSVPTVEVKRTYNSRSLYNGLFGFGWCSNLETRLTVLPEPRGSSLRVVECGGGMEVLYHPKGKVPNVKFYVDSILEKIKKRKVRLSAKALQKLKSDLLKSPNLRASFLSELDIKGQALAGVKYYAKGRVKEYITADSRGYTRHLPSGVKERFDKQGRLVRSSDRQGRFEVSWLAQRIQVMDQRGRRLIFHLDEKSGKIEKVTYGKKTVASYTHEGEDLAQAVNSLGEVFAHRYDKLHNLRQNIYPDKTTEVLDYNVKKDWVIGFKDRRGCKETYNFGVNKKNVNHYFSLVQKQCGRKIVNRSKYEFWHKTGPGGEKYLYRARARINGRVKTDVIYHPVFGSPISFFKKGMRTKRDYYANGFLKEKNNRYQNVRYSNYNKCHKPELVRIAYKNPNPNSKKKIVRRESITFQFDGKCRLSMAKKSEDEWIKVSHDSKGRIASMEDQSLKKVTLRWHKSFTDRPEFITREGVGSLRIVYDDKGSIIDLKGLKRGPTVVTQVTSVFNSFLSTLQPVSEEMVIL